MGHPQNIVYGYIRYVLAQVQVQYSLHILAFSVQLVI